MLFDKGLINTYRRDSTRCGEQVVIVKDLALPALICNATYRCENRAI